MALGFEIENLPKSCQFFSNIISQTLHEFYFFFVPDSLPRKIGVNQDAQGNWTCESCHWASPINHNLEEFVHQHSLFSPVCSHPEQKADFETKGVIVSTQYRPLSKRVFSKNTSLGTVLCYLKQPKLVGGVEVVQLFLFWENLTVSKETRTFLQEVYLIVGKLEQLHEIKFVIPLRTKGKFCQKRYILCFESLYFLNSRWGTVMHALKQSSLHSAAAGCLLWVWIHGLSRPEDRGIYSRMMIILGTIPEWFLVFSVHVPGCSRNGSGVYPDLRIQKKVVKFR